MNIPKRMQLNNFTATSVPSNKDLFLLAQKIKMSSGSSIVGHADFTSRNIERINDAVNQVYDDFIRDSSMPPADA